MPISTDGESLSLPCDLDSGNPCRNDDRTQACFWVSKAEIAANKYDLSINRYKETVHQEEHYDDPKEILQQWMSLVDEIQGELKELEGML